MGYAAENIQCLLILAVGCKMRALYEFFSSLNAASSIKVFVTFKMFFSILRAAIQPVLSVSGVSIVTHLPLIHALS